jgi:hypothetical protein
MFYRRHPPFWSLRQGLPRPRMSILQDLPV